MIRYKKYGNEDRVFMFTSTSKITFPGAGVSAIACSDNSMKYMCKRFSVMIISYDKMNQLRLVKGGGGHARQNVLCGFLAGLCGLIRGQEQPAVLDPQQQHQQPPHRDQQAGQRRAHQILQQHTTQRNQSSLFHRYPTPHTVLSSFSGSGTPAARSFARIFLMCWVTAVSSAVPSMPKTAS